MNRIILLLLLSLRVFIPPDSITAQKPKDDFGNITEADLRMTVCSIDTTAPAFVVYDRCEIEFVPGEVNFDVLYTRTLRMKILQKAGIRYGEMNIPLRIRSRGDLLEDKIRDLKAFTYNLADGKITKTKFDPKTVFEQKVNDNCILKKIAFPDVHEGSVLEIRYEIRSPFRFQLHDWIFQSEIPVLYSECLLKYTPFYLYTYVLKNAVKFDEYKEYQVAGLEKEYYNTKYKEGACKFVMKNVPAFNETDFLSSKDEYLVKLHFQLNQLTNTRGVSEGIFSTWDEVVKEYKEDDNFGKYIVSSQNISKQILEDEKILGMPPADRFNAIVSWVKKNLSWNTQESVEAEIKPKELLKRKCGSSAEINLFLCGMLKAAEIDAYPLLISTRGNARVIKDYPFFYFFNYAMVSAKAGEKWVLTDATEPFCENNSFPPRCINGKGLLIKDDITSWIDVSTKIPSSFEHRIRLAFTPGMDSLDARFTTIAKGYNALALRNRFGDDPAKAMAFFTEKGINTGDSLFITNAGIDSVTKPYIIRMNGKLPVEMTDQMLVVDPFCNMAVKKNPFDKMSRKYPVDLAAPENKTLIMELVIPAGYRVKKIPESFSWDHDQMSFRYISQQTENKIMLHVIYSVKNSVYPPEEYLKLQQYFADIIKKLHEKIYLEKIS
jgi:hypothetical protein